MYDWSEQRAKNLIEYSRKEATRKQNENSDNDTVLWGLWYNQTLTNNIADIFRGKESTLYEPFSIKLLFFILGIVVGIVGYSIFITYQ